MQNALIERGQVWHWEDPIYGSKEAGRLVNMLESGRRYSRYVITMTSLTIGHTKSSVLAIPCSSKNIGGRIVPFTISHLTKEKISYACLDYIFPVNYRSLTTFICKLSSNHMKKIESRFLQMVSTSLTDDQIHVLTGIHPSSINSDLHLKDNLLSNAVKKFVQTSVSQTKDSRATITIDEMLYHFERFCLKNDINISYDKVKFIDDFLLLTSCFGANVTYNDRYKLTHWNGLTITNFEFNVIPKVEEPIIVYKKRPYNVWTIEKRIEFNDSFLSEGVDKTAEKYNLSTNYCHKLYYKWKKKVEDEKLKVTPTPKPKRSKSSQSTEKKEFYKIKISSKELETIIKNPKGVLPDNEVDTPTPEKYCIRYKTAISTIDMLTTLTYHSIKISSMFKNLNALYEFPIKKRDAKNALFMSLDRCIMTSLKIFLGINKNGISPVIFIPGKYTSPENLSTWKFIENINTDNLIKNALNMKHLIEMHKKKYGYYEGISMDWISELHKIMIASNEFETSDAGIAFICSEVSNVLCKK